MVMNTGKSAGRRFWVCLTRLLALASTLLIPGWKAAVAQEPPSYEEWAQEQEETQRSFVENQRAQYARFLDETWESFRVAQGVSSGLRDKLPTAPHVSGNGGGSPTRSDETAAASAPDESEQEPRDDAGPAPPAGRTEKSTARSVEYPSLPRRSQFSFFGTREFIYYNEDLTPSINLVPGPEATRTFWSRMSSASVAPFVEQVRSRTANLGLDHWGLYLYLRSLSERLYGSNWSEAGAINKRLWIWSVLVKSGFDARIAYSDDKTFLLLPFESQVFDLPQLRINGRRYYLANALSSDRLTTLKTYPEAPSGSLRKMRFDLNTPPALGGASREKTVSFRYDGKEYNLSIQYNTQVSRLLRHYPDIGLGILFRSGLSKTARQSFREVMTPIVENFDTLESINFLLRFVQFGFPYKTDQDNFGEERFLLPDETLAESYSDCEDRAALFAHLVRMLLDVKVVGLRYPGHVATGIRIPAPLRSQVADKRIDISGHSYLVADPTYIGADAGMIIPSYENHTPTIIR